MNTAPQQIDRKGVLSFILLAYGLAWLVVSPLWLSGQGLRHLLAVPLTAHRRRQPLADPA